MVKGVVTIPSKVDLEVKITAGKADSGNKGEVLGNKGEVSVSKGEDLGAEVILKGEVASLVDQLALQVRNI